MEAFRSSARKVENAVRARINIFFTRHCATHSSNLPGAMMQREGNRRSRGGGGEAGDKGLCVERTPVQQITI